MAMTASNPLGSSSGGYTTRIVTEKYTLDQAIEKASNGELNSLDVFRQLPQVYKDELNRLSNQNFNLPFEELGIIKQSRTFNLLKNEIKKARDFNSKTEKKSIPELIQMAINNEIDDLELYKIMSKEVKKLLNHLSSQNYSNDYDKENRDNRRGILELLLKYFGAIAVNQEQEKTFREQGNINGVQSSLDKQALLYKDLGLLEEAYECYYKMETIYRQPNSNIDDNFSLYDIGLSFHNLALEIIKTGDKDMSIKTVKKSEVCSREYFSTINPDTSLNKYASTACNLSSALVLNGDWDSDENALIEAAKIAGETLEVINSNKEDNGFEWGALMNNWGYALFRMGEIKEQNNLIKQGIEKLENSINHFNSINNEAAVSEVEQILLRAQIAISEL